MATRKRKKEVKEVNLYKLRNEISEENEVHCLAFTAPLMDYGNHNDSDNEVYQEDEYPSIIVAKKRWKKLFAMIMDQRTQIPIKQMAWKAKHEDLLFQQM